MTYQEFLKENVKLYENQLARLKQEQPRSIAMRHYYQGALVGFRTALQIAKYNHINGEVATRS